MKIYLLEIIIIKSGIVSVETIGVYSSKSIAEKFKRKIEKANPNLFKSVNRTDVCELTVSPLMLDDEPILFSEPIDLEEITYSLMNKGLVDQLIGEDGNFYYILTDLGKQSVKRMREKEEEKDGGDST